MSKEKKGLLPVLAFFFLVVSFVCLEKRYKKFASYASWGPLESLSFDSLHSFIAIAEPCGWVGH